MNCPACAGTRFEKIGISVYCVTKVNGRLCGVTLKGDLRREFFEKHASHKDRKKYFTEYKRRHRVRYSEGLLVSEVADLKFCNRDTVLRNLFKFDIIKNEKPIKIKFNMKLLNWKPRGKDAEHKNKH